MPIIYRMLSAVSPERLNSTSPPPNSAAVPASPYHYFPYHHLRGRQYVGAAGSLGSASSPAPVWIHKVIVVNLLALDSFVSV